MRRLTSLFALLALLMVHTGAGPVIGARVLSCCCKRTEASHSVVSKASCCGQAPATRPLARVEARVQPPAHVAVLAARPWHRAAFVPPSSGLSSARHTDRSLGLDLGAGLPYRLRV